MCVCVFCLLVWVFFVCFLFWWIFCFEVGGGEGGVCPKRAGRHAELKSEPQKAK